MLKLCRVTKLKVFFLVLVYVFNFDLFEISAAILEKGLLGRVTCYVLSTRFHSLQLDGPISVPLFEMIFEICCTVNFQRSKISLRGTSK